MLRAGYLDIYPHRATLVPWHPEYGCIKVPAYTQIPNPRDLDYRTISQNMPRLLKELQIDIAEIPAHLCHDTTIQVILKPRCIVDHITFNPVHNKYCIEARAHSADAIPSLAHLGLNRFDNGHYLLHIWPFSLETKDITLESYLNMQFQLQEQNRHIDADMAHTDHDNYQGSPASSDSSSTPSACSHSTYCTCYLQDSDG